jgi:hypothetical protein
MNVTYDRLQERLIWGRDLFFCKQLKSLASKGLAYIWYIKSQSCSPSQSSKGIKTEGGLAQSHVCSTVTAICNLVRCEMQMLPCLIREMSVLANSILYCQLSVTIC